LKEWGFKLSTAYLIGRGLSLSFRACIIIIEIAMLEKNKKLKPKVDKNLCIGCGACVALCPEVFELKEDGKAYVKNPADCNKCDCQAAQDSCPVEAISLE